MEPAAWQGALAPGSLVSTLAAGHLTHADSFDGHTSCRIGLASCHTPWADCKASCCLAYTPSSAQEILHHPATAQDIALENATVLTLMHRA